MTELIKNEIPTARYHRGHRVLEEYNEHTEIVEKKGFSLCVLLAVSHHSP